MRPNILIVDDSAAIRKILRHVMSMANLPAGEVLEAGDGLQALAVLRDNPVGLILSDIAMPNMTGLELLGTLKRNPLFNALPVFMIAGEGFQKEMDEAQTLGAAGCVRKPFTAEQLKNKLIAYM